MLPTPAVFDGIDRTDFIIHAEVDDVCSDL